MIYVGVESQHFPQAVGAIKCLTMNKIATKTDDSTSASHFLLFITDTFLKDVNHLFPLVERFSDPHFKQRLFAIIIDESIKKYIYPAGGEQAYIEYWSTLLKNTNSSNSQYSKIQAIQQNIDRFIRMVRDTLVPSLDELLQDNFKQIVDKIKERSHLLQPKRFFFLPHIPVDLSDEQALVCTNIRASFTRKSVVTIGGAAGIGKTTLAVEYAKESTQYPTGIFWIDATNTITLVQSITQLAIQLGTSSQSVNKELCQMQGILLIYDNVTNLSLVPKIPNVHTLIVGTHLPNPDISPAPLTSIEACRYIQNKLNATTAEGLHLARLLNNHPAQLSSAISYIQRTKISVQSYIDAYEKDKNDLLTKQSALLKPKTQIATHQSPPRFTVDPSEASLNRCNQLSSGELASQLKRQGIEIFISYNWGAKNEVEVIDAEFKTMGLTLLRDARELRSLESIREFMRKVIRQADYTISVVTSAYLKSFNCIFEVITTMQDPYWQSRLFPIVLGGVDLDDPIHITHWELETIRLRNINALSDAAIAEEGAKKLGAFLKFVKDTQPEDLVVQQTAQFQKTFALMLARQERLEKKGIYKQAIFHLPLGRNVDFTGRDKELRQLETSLKQGRFCTITNVGMGGVGKTQLALEYAYRHQTEYEMVYWIRSETEEMIKTDYRMLGQEMGISEDFLKDDLIIATIRGELEKRQRWLVVYDNAESAELLAAATPQRGGHVIITSRSPHWTNAVNIDVFSENEALTYLQKISGVTGQDAQLKSLAKELGYLPLALTQAGAYIRRQQIDVATYQRLFSAKKMDLLSKHERGYPGTVATAWQLSFEKITQEDPNAVKLLHICSHLAPDNIPEEVLSSWLKEKNKQTVGLDFQNALSILENYALIHQKVEQSKGEHIKSVSIHRLIQAVSRDKCPKNEAHAAIQIGVTVLAKQFHGEAGTKKEFETAGTLVTHAQAIVAHAETNKLLNERVGHLSNEIGAFQQVTGDGKSALATFQNTIKIKTAVHGTEKHIDVISTYSNIGLIYCQQGNFPKAKEALAKATYADPSSLGEQGQDETAKALNNLGLVYQRGGELEKAKTMFERTFKIAVALKTKESNRILAAACGNLGSVLKELGDLYNGKRFIEKAIQLYTTYYQTENHLDVAEGFNNLGAILKEEGDLEGAKKAIEKAIDLYKAILKTDKHERLSGCYNNLGLVQMEVGNNDIAKKMFNMSLDIDLTTYKRADHINTGLTYSNLGLVFLREENYTEAGKFFEKALPICKKHLGAAPNIVIGDIQHGLGMVKEAQNDLQGAKRMFEESLKIKQFIFKEPHPSLAITYMLLGTLDHKLKNYTEAGAHLKNAQEMYTQLGNERFSAHCTAKIYACRKEEAEASSCVLS